MTMLESALELAKKGFHVFPVVPGTKLPAIKKFPVSASREPAQISHWWEKVHPGANIGISTTRFGDGEALLVVDVDNKGEKRGDEEILKLEMQGKEFPKTYTQVTPTGGRHLVYRCRTPVKQGVSVLGVGLDIRSRGGYIVGAGSEIAGKYYSGGQTPVAEAPEWLIEACGKAREKESPLSEDTLGRISDSSAIERAIFYLEKEAPISVKGQGGDQTAYKVAARVKDFGVSPADCLELMLEHWNDRCPPGWSPERLQEKVAHAYRYGTEAAGAAAPETQFDPIPDSTALHPFQELNKEFAFVIAGGGSHILWETKDHHGNFRMEHLNTTSFHQKLAAVTLSLGNGRTHPVTELWMKSAVRRSYDGICFIPGQTSPPKFYNLWRGFAVEPLAIGETPTREMKESLDAFLDHALTNVCRGDRGLCHWLMGYFAHLVQNPGEKPLVSLVFRGGKGVGKNALIDRVGHLLGSHYLLTSNRRYLVGNFNGHLENCLLFALDEAFWSGDKQAEGTLKDLITGNTHVIEHKGKEPYSVENCTRVIIIGNEDWLVPASQDERRFAVFDVGDGRKQDRNYFRTMREGMESGGYRLLLRYLLDYSLAGIEINDAPRTAALMDQKVNSLEPFYQWWLDCLHEGKVVGAATSEFGGGWPLEIDKEMFRQAFRRYVKERQIRSRIPEDRAIGRELKKCLPAVNASHKRREGDSLVNVYRLPELAEARKSWDKFIGHTITWE